MVQYRLMLLFVVVVLFYWCCIEGHLICHLLSIVPSCEIWWVSTRQNEKKRINRMNQLHCLDSFLKAICSNLSVWLIVIFAFIKCKINLAKQNIARSGNFGKIGMPADHSAQKSCAKICHAWISRRHAMSMVTTSMYESFDSIQERYRYDDLVPPRTTTTTTQRT